MKAEAFADWEGDVEKFVATQLELVQVECAAEEQQTLTEQAESTLKQLESKGVALVSLTITEKRAGLGGRTLLTLERVRGGVVGPLPAHRFSNGDIVALRDTSVAGVPTQQRQDDRSAALESLLYSIRLSPCTAMQQKQCSESCIAAPKAKFWRCQFDTIPRYFSSIPVFQLRSCHRARSLSVPSFSLSLSPPLSPPSLPPTHAHARVRTAHGHTDEHVHARAPSRAGPQPECGPAWCTAAWTPPTPTPTPLCVRE